MEDEIVQQEDSNLDAGNETAETEETSTEETSDEVTARLKKAEEVAKNQKIRAEKAEKELKALKSTPPEPKVEGLSAKDILALRDVHEDDVDYILEEAKIRNKSISELRKDPYLQIILKAKAEERASAQASNTGVTRRAEDKLSDDKILSDFNKGIVPESEDDIQRLVEAEMNLKKKIAKANKRN